MSLEKRFDGLYLRDGDLLYLNMNDGSEIFGRYRSGTNQRKQDEFYFDGLVLKDGKKYRDRGRIQDCMRLRVREVEGLEKFSEEEWQNMGL